MNYQFDSQRNDGLGGDCDLIIGNELIDFKVSKYDNKEIEDFYQLFLYAALYNNNNNSTNIINQLTIYNPLLGIEYNIKIKEFDYSKIFELIKEKLQN